MHCNCKKEPKKNFYRFFAVKNVFVTLFMAPPECFFALKSWNAQQAGAAAVLIADNIDEQLLTMDTPEASPDTAYIDKINIPSALVNRAFGESLKKMIQKADNQASTQCLKLSLKVKSEHT